MYKASEFLAAFRYFLPEAEHFIFHTLEQETLSPTAKLSLINLQNIFNLVKNESSINQTAKSGKVNFSLKSLLNCSEPISSSPFETLEDPIHIPISPSVALRESDHSSQTSDFKLNFDSSTNNSPVMCTGINETTTTTTTTTTTQPRDDTPSGINLKTKHKYFKTIKISKKPRTSDDFTSKKIKLNTDSPVVISDEDIYEPSNHISPLECDLSDLKAPIETDINSPNSPADYDLECFGEFNQQQASLRHNRSSSKSGSSSSSSSISSTSSSTSSSDLTLDRGLKEEEQTVSDVIDIHVPLDEAFPPSENNTPEDVMDTSQMAQVDTCEVAQVAREKLPVKSRLGTRVAPQDTIENAPPFNLKSHSERVLQYYSERPIKCGDCHSVVPLVTSGQLKCKHCSCKYKQDQFGRHMTPQSDTSQCHFCKVTFKTECEMNIHKTNKHPKIVLCENCLTLRKKLVPVVSSSSNSPKHSVDGSYKCQDCCLRFKTKLDLSDHTNLSHATVNSSPLVPESQVSLPERVPSLPTPRVQRPSGQELDPNCDLQLSKEDASREFEFLINKNL